MYRSPFTAKCEQTTPFKKALKIYKHTTPDGKVYIGSTTQSLNRRWRNGKGYTRNKPFSKAIELFGWNNIEHEVLYETINYDYACRDKLERYFIELYHSNDSKCGYNIQSGGLNGYTFVMTDEQKKKLSDREKGANNPFYGKKHSDKSLIKMSENRKGLCTYSDNGNAKAILQYDLNGNLIDKFSCIKEAQEKYRLKYGTNIGKCCHGRIKTYKGYIWKFAKEA